MDTVTAAAAPVAPPRRPRLSLTLLRGALTAHLLGVLAQPVLAGLFLSGDVDAIALHGATAGLIDLVAMSAVAIAAGYVIAGRGRLWVLPATVVLLVADTAQIAAGHVRQLEWHVPLGVAITVASVLMVLWVWSPRAARTRSGGRR